MTTQVLRAIQLSIDSTKIDMTEDEVLLLLPKARRFFEEHGRKPDHKSGDGIERRMGEALIFLQQKIREQNLK